MSCRSTKGGTAALRFVRRATGLTDKEATSLFHALKREGKEVDAPTEEQIDAWRAELRTNLESVDTTDSQKERSQRDLLATSAETYDGSTFYALSMVEARARQEQVLKTIRETAAPLDPPASQRDLYDLDENGIPRQVWYAAYGSNMHGERFNAYLTGEKYEGMSASSGGARDKTLPEDSVGVVIPGRMLFASRSGRWGGGGIAFIDADDEYSASAGKAYRIGWSQFEDVLAQESGAAAGSSQVDWKELEKHQELDTKGLYGRVLHIGDYKGAPVLTFTGTYSSEELSVDYAEQPKTAYRSLNQPHGNYVRTISRGLEEGFGLSVQEQADYLRGTLGGHYYSRAELVNKLNSPFEEVSFTPTRPAASGSRRSGLNASWKDPWPPKRDYVPWWADDNDPVNKRASSGSYREDEVPDWWYEIEDDADDAELQNWLDDMWDEKSPSYERPMAFHPTPSYYKKKACVICTDTDHDMHDCPYFEGRR